MSSNFWILLDKWRESIDYVEVIEHQPEVEVSLPLTESLDPCEREVEGVSSENLISDI